MLTQLIPSFNGGEFSPLVHRRTDLEKYRAGLKELKNFLITPYGGVRKRPGLQFIGSTKDNGKARLIRFQYSTAISYMLEVGAGYIRVWDSDGQPIVTVGEIVVPLAPGADPRTFLVDFYRNEGGTLYRCVEEHEETTFAADLAAGKWIVWTGPLEYTTPYTVDDLASIKVAQINAVMYFTNPLHPVHKFRFESASVGYFREVAWKYPALLDENLLDEITIEADFTVNASAAAWSNLTTYQVGARVTHGGKTWKANKKNTNKTPGSSTYNYYVEGPLGVQVAVPKPVWTEAFADNSSVPGQFISLLCPTGIFQPEHLGAYFEISKQREVNSYEVSIKAIDANDGLRSPELVVQGKWQFSTFGNWDGTFYLERSKDRGETWEDVRSWESDKDRNASSGGEEPVRCLMRLRWVKDPSAAASAGRPRGVLEAVEGYIRGVVKITKVTDSTQATGLVIYPVEKCVTRYWAEGAWSDHQGHPRTVAIHEGRVIYGGTERRSQDVWGSVADDYENFKRGTNDTDSWTHSLAADQQNAIQWLLSQKQLLIGTSGGEWVLASSKEDAIMTATNVRARRHSGHGSEYIPATLVNEATLFVQRGGRKLREMVFSFEADGYVTQDLTILADHITDGGVIDTAFQQQRDAVLWAVIENGELIGLTYERGQKVGGWHRHVTAGKFESVAVMATTGEEDEIWVSVCRVVDDEEKRYIERFRPDQFRAQSEADLADLFFVDAGVIAEAVSDISPINSINGLAHLNGKTVDVIADGSVLARRIVSGGEITLGATGDPDEALKIIVGLPYEALIEPLALEVGMQNGTSAGREKKIFEVDIFFHQSGGCMIGATQASSFDVISMRETGQPLGQPVPLFTGIKTAKLDARSGKEASFVIKQDSPVPLSILGVVPKWNINGDDD